VAPVNLARFKVKVRDILKGSRGRNLSLTIEQLNPVVRGWSAYFKLTETNSKLVELDGWIRRDCDASSGTVEAAENPNEEADASRIEESARISFYQ